jgi:hypothetical protein
VYFQDAETLRDAVDLLAVTKELHAPTGSQNLENDQALIIVKAIQAHGLLSDSNLETLRKLVAKYRPQIDALRAKPDRAGQNYLDVPDGASARLKTEEELA